LTLATIVLIVCIAGVGMPESGLARTVMQPTPLHSVSRHGYRLILPSGWRWLDASYPSDHFTDLYVDPTDANGRLVVVGSACEHCVTVGLSSVVAFVTASRGAHLDRVGSRSLSGALLPGIRPGSTGSPGEGQHFNSVTCRSASGYQQPDTKMGPRSSTASASRMVSRSWWDTNDKRSKAEGWWWRWRPTATTQRMTRRSVPSEVENTLN
jgi:hypothetical protein